MCVYMYVYVTCFLFGKTTDEIVGGWGVWNLPFLMPGSVFITRITQVTHHRFPMQEATLKHGCEL